MRNTTLPALSLSPAGVARTNAPGTTDGVRRRRVFAWLVDITLIALLWSLIAIAGVTFSVLTLGLAQPLMALVLALVPMGYHTVSVGGERAASPGMRLFGVRLSGTDGSTPGYLRAGLHAVVFYVSMAATAGLVLLLPLIDARKRTLHDLLLGLVMTRRGT